MSLLNSTSDLYMGQQIIIIIIILPLILSIIDRCLRFTYSYISTISDHTPFVACLPFFIITDQVRVFLSKLLHGILGVFRYLKTINSIPVYTKPTFGR